MGASSSALEVEASRKSMDASFAAGNAAAEAEIQRQQAIIGMNSRKRAALGGFGATNSVQAEMNASSFNAGVQAANTKNAGLLF